jgi:DNA-binding transcriptional MocR family regulator
MTMWTPEIAARGGARYLAIAEAIADDVREGRLAPGAPLPTHRDLAAALRVTVGTVTRAYAEAARRGLLRGEVGRGTFITAGRGERDEFAMPERQERGLIDLSLNFPTSDIEDKELRRSLASLGRRRGIADLLLGYQAHGGTGAHRQAGTAWLGRAGLKAAPDDVLVCSGGQHAMTVVFAALTRPGDTVLTETLCYPGMKALANLLHLRLHGLAIDAEGIRPDAFEAACRAGVARVLYVVPTIHNPTAGVLSEERRRRVASIARAHDVVVVEDDTYGMLPADRPRPIAAFAPDHTLYLASLSKCLAPGLRIAYLLAPPRFRDRAAAGIRSTTWMAAPLMAEIATAWIRDGTAETFLKRKRDEAAARQRLAARLLAPLEAATHPASFHLWLRLPKPWRSDGFVAEARRRGVAVTPAESFAVGAGSAPRAVRVCLAACRSRADLEKGLRILKDAAGGAPHANLSIV